MMRAVKTLISTRKIKCKGCNYWREDIYYTVKGGPFCTDCLKKKYPELFKMMERRASKRIQKTFVVELVKEGSSMETSCLNLSGSGMFIRHETPWELSLGDKFQLKFNLPGDKVPIVVDCEVQWLVKFKEPSDIPNGFAVEFVNMKPHDAQRIQRYITELEKE